MGQGTNNNNMQGGILVLNCGSSSVKFALFNTHTNQSIVTGIAENLNTDTAKMIWQHDEQKEKQEFAGLSHYSALEKISEILKSSLATINLLGIGHRVVHGGENFMASTIIDDVVISSLKACSKFAPLHNPANILGIENSIKLFPSVPQVAVFDTAFHQTMPAHAYHYALPYSWYEKHRLRRYGFHGTSYRYVSQRCAELTNQPLENLALLVAHLGNGCSACAILNGQSLDTTMGFTPLEGLVMGTRCGDIDPSIAEYITEQEQLSIEDVTKIFNKKSGLLGVSALSNDMRELLEASQYGKPQATLAIELFCYRLAKHLSGLTVALGKIDALIFTGGIGENSWQIREKVLSYLKIFNFSVDEQANQKNGKLTNGRITTTDSTLALVINTNEELMIAKDTLQLISKKTS